MTVVTKVTYPHLAVQVVSCTSSVGSRPSSGEHEIKKPPQNLEWLFVFCARNPARKPCGISGPMERALNRTRHKDGGFRPPSATQMADRSADST
jgi:hypothetical protein